MKCGSIPTARRRLHLRSCIWKYLFLPKGICDIVPQGLGMELPLPGSSQSNPKTSCPLVMLQSLLKAKGEGSHSLNGSLSTAPGEG